MHILATTCQADACKYQPVARQPDDTRLGAAHLASVVVGIKLDVIPNRVGRIHPDDPLQGQQLAVHDLVEHLLRVGKQVLCLCADCGVVEDLGVPSVGILAAQLPRGKEGAPIDSGNEIFMLFMMSEAVSRR